MDTSKITDVLDAVSSALSVIKTVADTPGISLIPYVSTISGAISALQAAYAVGKNITPYITAMKKTFDGDVPTPLELAALDAEILRLEAKVQTSLPPPDEGEPD